MVNVDKSGDRVRTMFAEIAPKYDLLNHLLSLNIDRWWRNRTVRSLSIHGNDPVLDVCTGTGDLALAIAKRHRGEIQVIGSDFCAPMLDLARKKAADVENYVSFVEADTQHLPFPDAAFQAVTVAFGIRNVAVTTLGIAEMIRVCKPGGQIAVLEFSRPTWPILKQIYDFYFLHVLPRVGQMMAKNDQSAYNYLPESVRQFPSGEAMASLMRDCGLREIQMLPMTFGIATLYTGIK